VAGEMWGVRQADAKGKHLLGLEIGLPVQQLRQLLLALRHSPDSITEITAQATNRHGRQMTLRVVCASVGETADRSHGAILLMQEVPAAVH